MTFKQRIRLDPERLRTVIVLVMMLLLFVAQLVKSPTITSSGATLLDYSKKTVMSVVSIGFIAAGVTLSIMTGNIDLSTGKTMTLCAIISCSITQKYSSSMSSITVALLAFLIPLFVGMVCGFFNGFLVGKLRLNAFVATFSAGYIFEASAILYNGGRTINAAQNSVYEFLGSGVILGVPVPILLMVAIYLVLGFVLSRTVFGKEIFAVGGNRMAARLSGVDPSRTIWSTYMLTGVLSALAGVFIGSWTRTADMLIGTNKEFNAITAVVLGGTLLSGGTGKLSGTFVGIIFLGVLDMFYIQFGIPDMWQWIVKGLILVIMLYVNGVIEKSKSRRKAA